MSLIDLMLFTPMCEQYFESYEAIEKSFGKEVVDAKRKAWGDLSVKLLKEGRFTEDNKLNKKKKNKKSSIDNK